jgi:NADH:ubiquinone oxidoreductase subunit 4 (subunit M)
MIVVLAGWEVIENKVAQYMAAFLIMSGLMNGIFSALDGVLFYVFFEASLIPMYIIIGVWGGANRVYAAIKFFLYTLLGSLLMLVALLYLFMQSGGSFSILDWHQLPLGDEPQILIFLAFLVAFARQGADVAGAYLVARCPRRSADRRLGGAGRDRAEARRLRFPALLAADRARRQQRLRR